MTARNVGSMNRRRGHKPVRRVYPNAVDRGAWIVSSYSWNGNSRDWELAQFPGACFMSESAEGQRRHLSDAQ
jgi:hypothetical protein